MKRHLIVLGACTTVVAIACSGGDKRPPADSATAAVAAPNRAVDTLSQSSPAWVVAQFFQVKEPQNFEAHLTKQLAAELKHSKTFGAVLKPGVKVSSRPVVEHDTSAVYETTLAAPEGTAEWYSFLVKQNGIWKLSSLRTLTLSQPVYAMLEDMRKGIQYRDAGPNARTALELTVGSDSALKTYARSHSAILDSIAVAFASRKSDDVIDVSDKLSLQERNNEKVTDPDAHIRRMLERSGASSVFTDHGYPGCVFLRLAGEGTKQAGYIRAGTGCKLPPITPDNFIYVEKAAGDLYAYKTIH